MNMGDLMNRLKKDWQDLAARSQVSEVGLDVDRAELLARYRAEGLTQQQAAECLGLPQSHISRLLLFGRYVASIPAGHTRISERRFRAYWRQIADPRVTRGRRETDAEYEALCFSDIRKLVDADTPPQRAPRKARPVKPADVKTIDDVRKLARRVFREKLRPQLARLKRLRGCDRATYAPSLLADVGEAIEREITELFTLLAGACEGASEHG
jgi:hypothetical protein